VLQVHLADSQGWLATFDLDETIRPDAQDAMGALRAMGLRLQLLSGDRMRHVARLAWRVRINHAFGDRTPEGKLAHVRTLQQRRPSRGHGGRRHQRRACAGTTTPSCGSSRSWPWCGAWSACWWA
jgi:hypothetical protein